jgi:hypothetical protein
MAPWLTKPAVADFVRTMRPRQVLAAHGGYAKDFFLQYHYATYGPYFEHFDIQFYRAAKLEAYVEL